MGLHLRTKAGGSNSRLFDRSRFLSWFGAYNYPLVAHGIQATLRRKTYLRGPTSACPFGHSYNEPRKTRGIPCGDCRVPFISFWELDFEVHHGRNPNHVRNLWGCRSLMQSSCYEGDKDYPAIPGQIPGIRPIYLDVAGAQPRNVRWDEAKKYGVNAPYSICVYTAMDQSFRADGTYLTP